MRNTYETTVRKTVHTFSILLLVILAMNSLVTKGEFAMEQLDKLTGININLLKNISINCEYSDGFTDVAIAFCANDEEFNNLIIDQELFPVDEGDFFKYSNHMEIMQNMTGLTVNKDTIDHFWICFRNIKQIFKESSYTIYIISFKTTEEKYDGLIFFSVPRKLRLT